MYAYNHAGFVAEIREYGNGILLNIFRQVYDNAFLVHELDGQNSLIREYFWGPQYHGKGSAWLCLAQNDQYVSHLCDGIGNIARVFNNNQEMVAAYTYDAFGAPVSQIGSLSQPMRFSSKKYDDTTGLSYFGYRFYSPYLGKWLTRDPHPSAELLPEKPHLYAFVGNNPVNRMDALGLQADASWVIARMNVWMLRKLAKSQLMKNWLEKAIDEAEKAVDEACGDDSQDNDDAQDKCHK